MKAVSAYPQPRITPEQYLEAERAAEFKSEYYEGRVYAMAGGSVRHALLIANLLGALVQALRGGTCRVLSSDARLRVSVEGLYTYPDVTVVCGEIRTADDHRDTILNPTVICEVLSQSTEAHDRGFKFAQYRRLDSLQEYLLVWQSEARIEKFRRQTTGEWVLSEASGLDAICAIDSLNCRIALSDVYDRITLGAEEPRQA